MKPVFTSTGKFRKIGLNPIYRKARLLLTKQRFLSLNGKGKQILRGDGKGYADPTFHMNLSRGYSTVSPITSSYADDLSNFGPFYKDSNYAFYLNWKPYTYWKGRVVIFPFSYLNSIMWHLKLIPLQVREKIGDLQSMVCALPSYIGSFPTLTVFSKTNDGFRGKVDLKLLDEVDNFISRLKLPRDVEPPTIMDVYHAKITPDTHPGLVTRKTAFKFSKGVYKTEKSIKKINVLHYCVNQILQAWPHISKGVFRDASGIYCLGSREKINVVDINDIVKTRPLMIPEFTDILHGSTWLEHLKTYWSKEGLFKSEIWLGHSDTKLRYYRRLEPEIKFKYAYDFDGKEWDSNVMSELIVKAFNIYRSCYKEGEATDNHFFFMMETLIYKRIILHNGNTWLLTKGIATGHVWTAFINSMVNWIIWTLTLNFCPSLPKDVKENYELQIQGDDVKIYCDSLLDNDAIAEMLKWMLENFNYRGKSTSCSGDLSEKSSVVDKSSFLKRIINAQGLLDTNIYDIFEKILMGPEYSGLRSVRYAYILRRVNDLAIFDEKKLKMLCLYASVIKNLGIRKDVEYRDLFEVLFNLTNGFTSDLSTIWTLFLRFTNINLDQITEDSDSMRVHLKNKYHDTYNKYDDKCDYVDYWKERKKSMTVSDALRNYDNFIIFPDFDLFFRMHSLKRKKR